MNVSWNGKFDSHLIRSHLHAHMARAREIILHIPENVYIYARDYGARALGVGYMHI